MDFDIVHIPEENFLVEILSGRFTLKDYQAMKSEEIANGWINSEVRTLAIIRDIDLTGRFEDMEKLAQWQQTSNPDQKGARTAILASNPIPTALAMFYAEMVGSVRDTQVFSTTSAALEWLQIKPEVISEFFPDLGD